MREIKEEEIGRILGEIIVNFFFFFKQKTAYEIGTGDWSSDVCSSDLVFLTEGHLYSLRNFQNKL